MHKGKLYGVGVGPGDPQLLTLKAVSVIRQCDYIAVPGECKGQTMAYKIVVQALPEIADKPCLCIPMPMTKDEHRLAQSHESGAEKLAQVLDQEMSIAFLTLGDPTIYSTYLYLHRRILAAGYEVEIVSGVPSFCAAAARLNMGLVERSQMLHVIPSSYQITEGIKLPGTKVFMKAGKKLTQVREELARGLTKSHKIHGVSSIQENHSMQKIQEIKMIENCGMENEKIYHGFEQMPETAGYYSMVIVKENETGNGAKS